MATAPDGSQLNLSLASHPPCFYMPHDRRGAEPAGQPAFLSFHHTGPEGLLPPMAGEPQGALTGFPGYVLALTAHKNVYDLKIIKGLEFYILILGRAVTFSVLPSVKFKCQFPPK